MGKFSHLSVGRGATIHLSYDSLRRRAAHVIQPGLDGHFCRGLGQIAKAEEIGVRGGVDPDGGFQFGRDAGGLRRVEAGAGGLKDAGEWEYVYEDLGEEEEVG